MAGLAPSVPSSNKSDTKEAASDNTNSTMIGSDGSQSAAKIGGMIIDCFFCSLVLIEGGLIGGRCGGKNITGEGVQTNQHKKIQLDLLKEREGNYHIYNNEHKVMNRGTD